MFYNYLDILKKRKFSKKKIVFFLETKINYLQYFHIQIIFEKIKFESDVFLRRDM